jgi:GAF domain-containing protein
MAGSRQVCLGVRWADRPLCVSAPDARAAPDTMSGVADTLTRGYGIGDVLRDLSSPVPEVLGLAGAGMTLADGGRARFATAPVEAIAATDELQLELQSGPSVEAAATGRPVTVDDLMVGYWLLRWPAYVSLARGAGLRAVAGAPMLAGGQAIGAINLYDDRARS